jgi:hypothetical protein
MDRRATAIALDIEQLHSSLDRNRIGLGRLMGHEPAWQPWAAVQFQRYDGEDMKPFRLQTMFVVVALIAASCQCSMACAVEPCQEYGKASQPSKEQLPPCHQHHQSKDSKNPHACLHTPFVLDNRAPSTLLSIPYIQQGERAGGIRSSVRHTVEK